MPGLGVQHPTTQHANKDASCMCTLLAANRGHLILPVHKDAQCSTSASLAQVHASYILREQLSVDCSALETQAAALPVAGCVMAFAQDHPVRKPYHKLLLLCRCTCCCRECTLHPHACITLGCSSCHMPHICSCYMLAQPTGPDNKVTAGNYQQGMDLQASYPHIRPDRGWKPAKCGKEPPLHAHAAHECSCDAHPAQAMSHKTCLRVAKLHISQTYQHMRVS